jgi:hypothetical protein
MLRSEEIYLSLDFQNRSPHGVLWREVCYDAKWWVPARRHFEVWKNMARAERKPEPNFAGDRWAVFAFGVLFVGVLLTLVVAIRDPTPAQMVVFRTVLALAAAGVAAFVPGLLHIELPVVRAGGALAVFVLVYLYSPAEVAVRPAPALPQPVVSRYRVCSGEYERNCDAHDVYMYCYADVQAWADKKCEKGQVVRLNSRGGNKCGYSLDEVICTGPK